ncbi:hypothetical protein ACVBEG_16210 [Pseudomonas sp. GG8]
MDQLGLAHRQSFRRAYLNPAFGTLCSGTRFHSASLKCTSKCLQPCSRSPVNDRSS